MESHSIALEQTSYMIDNEIQSLYQIDYQITSANDNLHSYFLMEDTPSRDIKITSELSNCISSTTFISEVALLSKDNKFIYTSSGVYPTDLYFKNIFKYEELTDPIPTFLSMENRSIRVAEGLRNSERYLTFINPPYSMNNFPTTTVLFWVNELQFKKLVKKINDNNSVFLILNEAGESVLTLDKRLTEKNIFDLSLLPTDGSITEYTLGDTSYYVFLQTSNVTGFRYIVLLSNATAVEAVQYIQNIFYFLIALSLMVGIIAIILYMRITYLPLKRLKNFTDDLLTDKNGDEIESLRDALHCLSAENTSLVSTWQNFESLQSLKDSLVFSAIKGQFNTIEQFNQAGNYLNLKLTKSNFQVSLLKVASLDSEQLIYRNIIQQELETGFSTEIEFYFRELFEANQYVILIAMDNSLTISYQDCYKNLMKQFREKGYLATIGAGSVSPDFSLLKNSYLEASLAMRDIFITGAGSLICFDAKEISPDTFHYPINELEDLKLALNRGDYFKFGEIADQLFHKLRNHHLPSNFAKGLCYNISHLLLSKSNADVIKSSMHELFLLNYAESLEDYRNFLHKVLSGIQNAEKRTKLEDYPLIDQIRMYIEENYDNCNFSIQEAAAVLGMNSSYLSQYFKAQTNSTLNDYVTSLRIKKAENMLKGTTIPLNTVAEEVGYYNHNSFIRRFKQITGVTPGEYRKQNS